LVGHTTLLGTLNNSKKDKICKIFWRNLHLWKEC
jgi:hypothetical protein